MEQANQGSRYSIPSAPEINTRDDYQFLYRTSPTVEMKSSRGNIICIFQKAIMATSADKNIGENTINFQIWGRLREAEVKRDRSVGQRAEQHVQSDLWSARWRAQDRMLSLSTASSLSSFFIYLFFLVGMIPSHWPKLTDAYARMAPFTSLPVCARLQTCDVLTL